MVDLKVYFQTSASFVFERHISCVPAVHFPATVSAGENAPAFAEIVSAYERKILQGIF